MPGPQPTTPAMVGACASERSRTGLGAHQDFHPIEQTLDPDEPAVDVLGESSIELVLLRWRHRNLLGFLRELIPELLNELQPLAGRETVEVDGTIHLTNTRSARRSRQRTRR
jgi:hypothetical protein